MDFALIFFSYFNNVLIPMPPQANSWINEIYYVLCIWSIGISLQYKLILDHLLETLKKIIELFTVL